MKRNNLLTLVMIAVLGAISTVLSFMELPIFPAASYLKYDPSEVVIIILMLIIIPVIPKASLWSFSESKNMVLESATPKNFLKLSVSSAIIVVFIKATIHFLFKNEYGIAGYLPVLLSGLAFIVGVLVCELIFYKGKFNYTNSPLYFIVFIITNTASLTVFLTLFNKFFLLSFYGTPENLINETIFTAIIPFNILKGILTSILGLSLCVALGKSFKRR